jgi:hypothetical protein
MWNVVAGVNSVTMGPLQSFAASSLAMTSSASAFCCGV